MQNKRKATITGVALVVSLLLLFASATVVYSGGEFKPLAAVYDRLCNVTGLCMYVRNYNTGSVADALWAITGGDWGVYAASYGTSGEGLYGYASGTSGTAVYGYSANYIGVRGTGDEYGGYFTGDDGVRAVTSMNYGYGVWASAYGTGGQGVHGYASGTSGYGVYGYSYRYVGVYGSGCSVGVYGNAWCTSGKGVYGYASGTYGEGVRGYTAGYGGDGVTAYATNSYGYGVDSLGAGYGGHGIRAQSSGSYGLAGYFNSTRYRGIYANGASGWYDAYFPDFIYAGGTVISSSGIALEALNDGAEALEPGDLVAFSGFAASAGDSSTLAVQKANGANSSAIIGVVQAAYVKEAPVEMQPQPVPFEAAPEAAVAGPQKEEVILPEEEPKGEEELLPPLPQPEAVEIEPEVVPELDTSSLPQAESLVDADVGHFVEGAAQPGQYVIVVIQGITQVKVDASAAPVRAGDMLVASAAGYAINATAASQPDGASRPREGAAESGGSPRGPSLQALPVGRALESLETGTGTIYVYVSVR